MSTASTCVVCWRPSGSGSQNADIRVEEREATDAKRTVEYSVGIDSQLYRDMRENADATAWNVGEWYGTSLILKCFCCARTIQGIESWKTADQPLQVPWATADMDSTTPDLFQTDMPPRLVDQRIAGLSTKYAILPSASLTTSDAHTTIQSRAQNIESRIYTTTVFSPVMSIFHISTPQPKDIY